MGDNTTLEPSIARAASLLRNADALLIGAGAGVPSVRRMCESLGAPL
jgi:thiamine pyrophosphate-dependent acetolactate synthase large subunit-like protein